MDRISKINKIEPIANNLANQDRGKQESELNNFDNFDSVLEEESRKLDEKNKKDKMKSKKIQEIYKVEVEKLKTKSKVIKQKSEENIEHNER